MLKQTYHQSLLSMMNVGKVVGQISEYETMEYLPKGPGKETNVRLITNQAKSVNSFYHPILIYPKYLTTKEIESGRPYAYVDVRGYVTVSDQNDLGYRVTNESEFKFLINRAELEILWQGEGRFWMAQHMGIPMNYYSKWVSEAIARVLGLSIEEQVKISAWAAFYFWCQFKTEEELPENWHSRAIAAVSRNTELSANSVAEYLAEANYMPSAESFIGQLREYLASPVFDTARVSDIRHAITASWRGAHAREVAMVAIEFPPAFIAMVMASAEDRTFKRTSLQLILERLKRRIDVDQFCKSMRSLITQGY